ncbi:delta-like protein C isoform X1 [Tetranychus urticae]|uniref:delta-like protein C isoform X1 n=1 Tax=Tetranychus urticae TaxID=32264 RepID=UPI00077C0A80|nr:delta-like protein C isoform X1 [Tetranychus urticae]
MDVTRWISNPFYKLNKWIILYLTIVIHGYHSSGIFQVEVVEFEHKYLYSSADDTKLVYNLCLKESNTLVYGPPCTYGIVTSQPSPPSAPVSLRLPFTFRWMKSFTLIVTIMANNGSTNNSVQLEKQIHFDDNVLPTNRSSNGLRPWLYKTFKSTNSHLVYRYRVYCSLYYHGDECSEFCRERNDVFGHYGCRENGQKSCLTGWIGDNCDKPKCRPGCNSEHGYCSEPDQCQCRPGYSGPLCNQCLLYPGCINGYCLKPWQCICHRNWGGILCDQDLNFCGTHQPCLNGGLCDNIAPNQYKCHCKPGYDGNNCQIVVNPCVTSPCLHGGTCSEVNNSSFICNCPAGWTGNRCQININECSSNPCQNDGKCIDLINGYQCVCPPGFTGDRCQDDINECNLEASLSPCIPSTTESCQNIKGSYKCKCIKGFEGQHCESNVNDCEPNPCANDGSCIDLVNAYQCVCQKGFKGAHCQQVDENVCSLGGSDNYWEITTRASSCPMKWCKCSHDKGPFCICVGRDLPSITVDHQSLTEPDAFNSLVLVFEKILTNNQTQIICEALKAILILYQDTLDSKQMSTVCHRQDINSLVFYSLDNSENVLKIGDILLNSRNSFRIKQIIKNKQELDADNRQIQFLLVLTLFCIFLFICFSSKSIHNRSKQYIRQFRSRIAKFIAENQTNAVQPETINDLNLVKQSNNNNLNQLDDDCNNQRPISINILNSSPNHFKFNHLKLKQLDTYENNECDPVNINKLSSSTSTINSVGTIETSYVKKSNLNEKQIKIGIEQKV